MSLHEISENMKLAREYALLGNYNSANVFYRGVLEQIKKFAYTVSDSGVQQRWQQVSVTRFVVDWSYLHCSKFVTVVIV